MYVDWIGRRDKDEVISAFEEVQAAVAPIYDVADVMRDPQYRALESIVELPDEELGRVKMQNVMFRVLGTPGAIRWPGRQLGEDNAELDAELGITPERLGELRQKGVI